jgi:hypothetical protein
MLAVFLSFCFSRRWNLLYFSSISPTISGILDRMSWAVAGNRSKAI